MKKVMKVVLAIILLLGLLVGGGAAVIHFIQYPPLPRPNRSKKRIACIGDSITYGAGVVGHHKTQTYPAYLQKLLGDDYQVLNYGLSGRTMCHTGDNPYIEEKQYEASLKAEADVYLIMLGTNDTKPYNWDAEVYENDLRSFVESYQKAAPGAEIYLIQPGKCFVVKGETTVQFDIQNELIEGKVREIVAQVADELGCGCIDLYDYTEEHPEWFDDGVHPNAKGNLAIAKFLWNKLDKEE